MQGKYIVIEGLEGAGKSTAVNTVCSILDQRQIDYHTTREPGGTPIAESIRTIIKGENNHEVLSAESELLLMYAARKQLLNSVIMPKLYEGTWVISDRNEWSSIAYQGYGRNMNLKFVDQLSKFAVGKIYPDLILYLDISPEIGLQRAGLRGNYDRIEQEPKSFFERVYYGYKQLIANNERVRIVSANLPIEKAQEKITSHVIDFLNLSGKKHG